ncbi:LOW QUALITY PROTEIN: hypothetical protein HID58_079589 [Brassica napus]|uniref:Uncharacterized protein n=1 Tax=Brassica napus TaxID=3708 RepID=A0ABQ7Y4X2_BRANA|nr:LOW QUALITY PROTEIN: hypothetical protein HID58_079589 [Brassica napus]
MKFGFGSPGTHCFDVTRSNNHFKLCNSNVAIRLNQSTKMSQLSLIQDNPSLSDILGEVCDIRTTYNDHIQTTQRLMVNDRVDKDATVCVSVFDSLAELLHKRLEAGNQHQPQVYRRKRKKINVTAGRLHLNATSGNHFILTMRWPQTIIYLRSCQPDNDSTSGKQYRGVKKLEQVSLGELENYVLESPSRVSFYCNHYLNLIIQWIMTLSPRFLNKLRLLSSYANPRLPNWKKLRLLQRGMSSFTCPTCFNASVVGVVRFN